MDSSWSKIGVVSGYEKGYDMVLSTAGGSLVRNQLQKFFDDHFEVNRIMCWERRVFTFDYLLVNLLHISSSKRAD